MNWLAVQLLGEGQQQLRQVARRLKAICTRPVIPLLVALQLQLQTKHLDMQFACPLDLFFRAPLLRFQ